MKKLRCAVIGVGYLGKFHAQKYALLPTTELVAVVDTSLTRAQEVADQFHCQSFADYQGLVGIVDAVSIVSPTLHHFEIAQFCLQQGIHCLIEKPITTTVEQAEQLIELANKHHTRIQVGHLERFNSAVLALHSLQSILNQPKFIESHRIAPFNLRSKDVNVILDLMIHDIDLIRSLVNSDIKSIAANGAPILSDQIDIANARIEFMNGAVANVTASRAGTKQERMMRLFQEDAYISINLQEKSYSIYRRGQGEMFPGIPEIKKETHEFPEGDAIKAEIEAFADSILNNKPILVTAEDGKKALEIAQQITRIVQASAKNA